MEIKPTLVLASSRVFVWNLKDAERLYREGFYGKFIGVGKPKTPEVSKPLELSLIESVYLLEKGRARVVNEDGVELGLNEVRKVAEMNDEFFSDHYRVYKELREKDYVVRPGLKFGATFAVYRYGPGIDHAPFLVHVVPHITKISPLQVVSIGRLSHSVRKKLIIATTNPSTKELNYYMFSWWKP